VLKLPLMMIVVCGLCVTATPALADQKNGTTASEDPNQKICENIVVTGSRLASGRFCGTRAEWAERKRADREALDAAQRGPCVLTHNNGGGHPSC